MTRRALIEMAEMSLEADANARRARDQTPPHPDVRKGWAGPVSVRLESGASIETRDGVGWTPLHNAARGDLIEATRLIAAGGTRTV